MSILRDLFGPGTWGTGGNMVAWVICGTLGLGWLHAKEKARHVARMAQAATHHKDQMALLAKQHAEHLAVAEKQHQETHRRLDQHAELIAAVAAQPASPVAEQVMPEPKRGARK